MLFCFRLKTYTERANQVGSEGAQWEVNESASSDTCAGDLKQLPRNEFDVLVFSLVLSYLPHPLLRTRMMAKVLCLLLKVESSRGFRSALLD